MKNFSCSLLITFMFLASIAARAQISEDAELFIPDSKVDRMALQFDRKYFPRFLRSLEDIKDVRSRLIRKYLRFEDGKEAVAGICTDIAGLPVNVLPVYRSSNPAEPDYEVKFPISWSDTIRTDPSWMLYFQSLTWLNGYLSSSDTSSVIVALKVADDWIRSHTTYPAPGEKFAFDDHAVAERMVVLVSAFSRYNALGLEDPDFRTRLLVSILGHIFFVASLEKYKCWHNHAIIFDQKLITALITLPEFTRKKDFMNLAFNRLIEQYRYSYTSEGVHKEHSPCYHKWFTATLNSVIDSAAKLGVPVPVSIISLQKKANEYARVIELNPAGFPIGDCTREVKPSENETLFQAAGKWSLTNYIYPKSGWFYVYDSVNAFSIAAQSDFFSLSHYQQDETSFTVTEGKNELIIDPGLYSYTQSEVYDYYRSTRAHNMVVVEGIKDSVDLNLTGLSGITRYYAEPDGNGNFTGGVEMTHAHYQKYGIDVHRQFIFPGGHKFVVRDIINSPDTHIYHQLIHFAPGAIITRNENGYFVRWGHHPDYLVIKSNFDTSAVIEGEREPLQGWYFPAFNKIAEAPVLQLTRRGAGCEFITTITVGFPGSDKTNRSQNEMPYRLLVSKLESVERRLLVHQPFPAPWKPAKRR